ncbi:HsdM family class I SAM-dependent methyltransferase [Streptococcus himalayensis]|uniref:site-specific DNA-methyltransferase (adenine-specific) n=1 Tax=Streptococcus himalayensis TaxID=1888195 RepID=A0A917A6J1_9STRE|nr:class I SAM-dependent DNA methyltransferase [Streptococcus himalayensis]GGE31289.1 DNA methyltransferase [Streptococcus himalayensis]
METTYTETIKQLVDDLKAIFTHAGLGGEAGEYKLLTQSFLYKFLNDKFLYEAKKVDPSYEFQTLVTLSEDDYEFLLMDIGNNTARMKVEHLLESLHPKQNEADFSQTFDDTLNAIAVENNDIFSVHTAGNTDIRLFDAHLIAENVADFSKRNDVAKKIINKLASVRFDEQIFSEGFDFFLTIFEYMIKDYNKDGGGKYAEYYTPHSVAKIIAEILVGKDDPYNVKIYDPSAGSGSLLMNLAGKIGTDKTSVYSQDISQKSSNLLRLNLILNGLSHSIQNIVQGNTIIENRHTEKMDYIVSNPPFKLDFSDWQAEVETQVDSHRRFFAGVPSIPRKKKESMAIYQLFLQHIIYSLREDGKAAVVVPTGFITAQSGIDKKIRQHLVKEKMLAGVVSMPSNIFATTGTNVSILFIDKTNKGDVILIDASNLGSKVKEGSNQKTVLSAEEETDIIHTFIDKEAKENFSVLVSYEEIEEKNYSLSAGQYFEIKIDYVDITAEEFERQMAEHQASLEALFSQSRTLEEEIMGQLGKLGFGNDDY